VHFSQFDLATLLVSGQKFKAGPKAFSNFRVERVFQTSGWPKRRSSELSRDTEACNTPKTHTLGRGTHTHTYGGVEIERGEH